MNIINLIISSILIHQYFDGYKTVTSILTNIFLIVDKIYTAIHISHKSVLETLPYSAYMKDYIIFNTIDKKYKLRKMSKINMKLEYNTEINDTDRVDDTVESDKTEEVKKVKELNDTDGVDDTVDIDDTVESDKTEEVKESKWDKIKRAAKSAATSATESGVDLIKNRGVKILTTAVKVVAPPGLIPALKYVALPMLKKVGSPLVTMAKDGTKNILINRIANIIDEKIKNTDHADIIKDNIKDLINNISLDTIKIIFTNNDFINILNKLTKITDTELIEYFNETDISDEDAKLIKTFLDNLLKNDLLNNFTDILEDIQNIINKIKFT